MANLMPLMMNPEYCSWFPAFLDRNFRLSFPHQGFWEPPPFQTHPWLAHYYILQHLLRRLSVVSSLTSRSSAPVSCSYSSWKVGKEFHSEQNLLVLPNNLPLFVVSSSSQIIVLSVPLGMATLCWVATVWCPSELKYHKQNLQKIPWQIWIPLVLKTGSSFLISSFPR